MKREPFTLLQAKTIAARYQYLVGQPYDGDNSDSPLISCVVVAPFDELNKWIYINFYADEHDPQKALNYYYYPYYDVLIIAPAPESPGYIYSNIRDYLQAEKHAKTDGQLLLAD